MKTVAAVQKVQLGSVWRRDERPSGRHEAALAGTQKRTQRSYFFGLPQFPQRYVADTGAAAGDERGQFVVLHGGAAESSRILFEQND